MQHQPESHGVFWLCSCFSITFKHAAGNIQKPGCFDIKIAAKLITVSSCYVTDLIENEAKSIPQMFDVYLFVLWLARISSSNKRCSVCTVSISSKLSIKLVPSRKEVLMFSLFALLFILDDPAFFAPLLNCKYHQTYLEVPWDRGKSCRQSLLFRRERNLWKSPQHLWRIPE